MKKHTFDSFACVLQNRTFSDMRDEVEETCAGGLLLRTHPNRFKLYSQEAFETMATAIRKMPMREKVLRYIYQNVLMIDSLATLSHELVRQYRGHDLADTRREPLSLRFIPREDHIEIEICEEAKA